MTTLEANQIDPQKKLKTKQSNEIDEENKNLVDCTNELHSLSHPLLGNNSRYLLLGNLTVDKICAARSKKIASLS